MARKRKPKMIIFLDIDGVLNHSPDKPREVYPDLKPNDERIYGLNPKLIANLKKVIDETGAKIVVSSSWRYFDDYFIYDSSLKWRDVLANRMGYKAKDLFIGNTHPSIAEYVWRGHEIHNWMTDHEDEFGKAGTDYKYCVIDDEVRSILEVIDPRYVIHTDYKKGFTPEDAIKAIHVLETA